jgi:hypothetical protein
MEKSSYYLEMFPDEIEPGVQVPGVLTDDPLFALIPGTGAASTECQRLQDESFAAEIAGLEPTEFRQAVSSLAPFTPRSLDRIVADSVADVEVDFGVLVKRVTSTMQKAPEHRREVQKIVDGMRGRLRKFEAGSACDFDMLYSKIPASMVEVVQLAVVTG